MFGVSCRIKDSESDPPPPMLGREAVIRLPIAPSCHLLDVYKIPRTVRGQPSLKCTRQRMYQQENVLQARPRPVCCKALETGNASPLPKLSWGESLESLRTTQQAGAIEYLALQHRALSDIDVQCLALDEVTAGLTTAQSCSCNFSRQGSYRTLLSQRLFLDFDMAVGQKHWYHFGVGAPPILVYFIRDWDVHWGYDLDFDPWPYQGPRSSVLDVFLHPSRSQALASENQPLKPKVVEAGRATGGRCSTKLRC